MEQESSMRSISQNIAIATPDVKVTDNCGDGTQSNLDFESDIDLNGSIEVEDSDVQDIEEELEATKPNGNVDSIHSKVHQDLIPVIGMEFETEDDAHAFYNRYAYSFGFSTRKSKAHNSSTTGMLRDRLFVCSAEGKYGKDKRNVHVKSHRVETRFNCLARMKISYQFSSKYSIVEFIADHTHTTSTPSKSHLFRSHRKMSLAHIAQVDMADNSGIAPKATQELLSRQAGGREHLGFIPEDYRNYLLSKRTREVKSGDTGGVLEYLQRMQLNDPNFVYAIQVDQNNLITNIFWADARMMVDYDYFGDVVCFHTTYRKNKEGRPFAMFVGVSNYKQTLIFGATLLYDETTETFIWLFDIFAKTMSGKTPKSILLTKIL
ncbi:hypothetical protein M0R45_020098 [Rubus argutus]|uniref:Protein FAR1-RELATED SEQUENCE n=1 Tax=Rubus argutus TaxID=59490 RepID=A0AAW1X9N6_RUBAR